MSDPRPVIGDFRTTPSTAARKTPDPVPVEEKVAPVPQEPDIRSTESVVATTFAEMKAAEQAELALTPAERYQKRLREATISLADATAIYDAVLTNGYHETYVRLGKSGRAVFRTRVYEDALRLQTALEMEKPQLVITQDELITRYNLAASLYEWQGKAIPHETDADFQAALKLIRRFPGPVYSLLAMELAKFDQRVMAVFSEGAAENFS